MDSRVFNKMKLKEGITGKVINAPAEYEEMAGMQTVINFSERSHFDFVHLFVTSQAQFEAELEAALKFCSKNGAFWVSYPKSAGKEKYDINRDVIFNLSQNYGVRPVSQVALDDRWSAMRLKSAESCL